MKLMYCSPCQVPKEKIVLILSGTVVSMKFNMSFAKTMVVKVMVNEAYCSVCPFTNVTCFVNLIVNLARDRFAHDAKNSAFPWRFKVDQAWLHRVTGDVNLLGKVR